MSAELHPDHLYQFKTQSTFPKPVLDVHSLDPQPCVKRVYSYESHTEPDNPFDLNLGPKLCTALLSDNSFRFEPRSQIRTTSGDVLAVVMAQEQLISSDSQTLRRELSSRDFYSSVFKLTLNPLKQDIKGHIRTIFRGAPTKNVFWGEFSQICLPTHPHQGFCEI